MTVQCYIATASADDDMFTTAARSSTTVSELSAQLPAHDSNGPERILGTLDLNQGDCCSRQTVLQSI